MSARTIVVGLLALLSGGSAALVIYEYGLPAPMQAAADTVNVAVAAVDIQRGTTISELHVKMRARAKGDAPAGVVLDLAACIGRSALVTIVKDELLLDSKMAAKGAGRGLSALVPAGMRGHAVQVPTFAAGGAGFILPGNRVDVLLTVMQAGQDRTFVLLEDMEILAVGQQLQAPAENKVANNQEMQIVTLLCTPEQANKLTLAQTRGMLHLTLRNPEDRAASATRPITLNELMFLREGPLAGVAPKQESAVSKEFWQAATLLVKKLAEARPVAASAPPKQPMVPPRIRTLRGRQDGSVFFNAPIEAKSN